MSVGPLRTLLLDFDGTIADSIELILASYRHAFTEVRGAAPPDELWLKGVGTPLLSQLRDLARSPEEIDLLFQPYREFAISQHDRYIRSFDGMRSTLEAFAAASVPLGIVTSKNRVGLQRGLRALDLEACFSALYTIDDSEHHKPHPQPVELAMAALSARPESTLFAGDSLHDLEAGRAAGVTTAAALWGPFDREQLAAGQPDHWLEHPTDLLGLFGLG